MSDLRSKLNAKAEAEAVTRAAEAEATRKYREVLLREYPRLCKDLLERVTALVGGVKDLEIKTRWSDDVLLQPHGSSNTGFQETPVGTVHVPHFSISIAGQQRIGFKPAGIGYVGMYGAIEVATRTVSLPHGKIYMMPGKGGEDTEHWELALMVPKPTPRSFTTTLTDDKLSKLLEEALL